LLIIGVGFLFSFNSPNERLSLESKNPTKKDVALSLQKLQLDTLYVINRICSNKLTKNDLEEGFHRRYDFSNYRILDDNEVRLVSEQKNVVHYAVVGQYYTHTGSPLTNGVYLLDKNSELCVRPYPYHVRQGWLGYLSSKCLNSNKDLEHIIAHFNLKLKKAARKR